MKNYRLPVKLPTGPVSEHTRKRSGSVRIVDLNQRMVDSQNAAAMTTRCAFCDWTFDGTASEGRQEALRHRESAHPEVLLVKSKRPRRRRPTPPRKVT